MRRLLTTVTALVLGVSLATLAIAQSTPYYVQQNDLQMMNDLNNDLAQGRMPSISVPTGMGGGAVQDAGGPVTDFTVIADNSVTGLLDCTLRLVRPHALLTSYWYRPYWQVVRMRYWKNIAGQLLHEITGIQLGPQRQTSKIPNANGGCDPGWHILGLLCVPN